VVLEALPLTPNGKLDRGALPAPEAGGEESVYEAPRTAVEELVAGIWAEVLELGDGRRIGVQDDFFQMGGHSLLATQVIARVQQVFGVDLPLRALFEAPNVGDFAARVDATVRAGLEEWELEEALGRLDELSDHDVEQLLRAASRRGREEAP
ncbi:MAG TPA: phosphopantetheine-binding protein, partial [Longimicrobiaceae bacterium]|nr:phosphopantetheine-binding protein [Longimicrobiaceae bacterium]